MCLHCSFFFKRSDNPGWNIDNHKDDESDLRKRSKGRTFTGTVEQDVVVNGATVLKAGTPVTGKITASRSSSRPGRGSAPLGVALTSIKANGSRVAIKTGSVQPQGATTAQTAQMRSRGVTAGNILVTPGTTMQFVLSQAVTL